MQKLQLISSHKRSLIVSFSRWTHLNTRGSLRDYGRIHKVPKNAFLFLKKKKQKKKIPWLGCNLAFVLPFTPSKLAATRDRVNYLLWCKHYRQ